MPIHRINFSDLFRVALWFSVIGEETVGFLLHIRQLGVAEAVNDIGVENGAVHVLLLLQKICFICSGGVSPVAGAIGMIVNTAAVCNEDRFAIIGISLGIYTSPGMSIGKQKRPVIHSAFKEGLLVRFAGGTVIVIVDCTDITFGHFPTVIADDQAGGVQAL